MNVLDLLDDHDMLPCPFCGHETPRILLFPDRNDCMFAEAYCPHCHCRVTLDGSRKTSMEARTAVVRLWNRRDWRPE